MYTKAVLGTHLFLPIEELQTPIEKLKSKLTARPKYEDLAPIPMYSESLPGYFGIPRYFGVDYTRIKKLRTDVSYGESAELVFTSQLRDNQVPLYGEFIQAVDEGKTGFIIEARTGIGKTVLMLKFLEYLGVNALVVVPSEPLMIQWKEHIVAHTSYSESDIGHVQADVADYKDKPITIAMLHSICRDKYGEEFNNYFGAVFYDEIHRCGAEHFSKAVSIFTSKYRIGASASVDRPDGMDVVFRYHIGEKLISLGSEREEENRPKIIVIGYEGAKQFIPGWAFQLDKVRKRGVVISALAKDEKRSDVLLSAILRLSLSGRRVLVLSDRIEQLQYLVSKTHALHKPGLYIAKTSKREKADILENSGIIYATFQIFSTGMDVPDLAGLVLGTPQSRIRQAVGRISRLSLGKKRPVIVDLVDRDIKECKKWHRSRLSEYNHPDIKGTVITL